MRTGQGPKGLSKVGISWTAVSCISFLNRQDKTAQGRSGHQGEVEG